MEQLINALPSLLKKQQELDDYIMRERGLTHDETIEQRKLAFVVELAELAQEWRGFKYWSDNQEPNLGKVSNIECDVCLGLSAGKCVCCHIKGFKVNNPMLEEYVDVLHFALSLHNYYEGNNWFVGEFGAQPTEKLNEGTLSTFFLEVAERTCGYNWSTGETLAYVLDLSVHLELQADDILKEYDRKYQINIERQNNGY